MAQTVAIIASDALVRATGLQLGRQERLSFHSFALFGCLCFVIKVNTIMVKAVQAQRNRDCETPGEPISVAVRIVGSKAIVSVIRNPTVSQRI